MQDFSIKRNNMVETQLIPRGIKSSAVLDAMRNVPRHLFMPEHLQSSAYEDTPLPIGLGQTISQPYIVAYMTEQLDLHPGMKVLEIGTGSGYQAAILGHMGCKVFSREIIKEHADRASEVLAACGYNNVSVSQGSGILGLPKKAPFHAIIVTAAPDYIPPALIRQLKTGGKMIIPVGEVHDVQMLKLITKTRDDYTARDLLPVRFVPLVDPLF